MKKYLLLSLAVLFPLLLSTGCGSDKNTTDVDRSSEVTRYRSGAIMIKDKGTYDASSEDRFNPGAAVQNVDVGPSEVQFGPDENF